MVKFYFYYIIAILRGLKKGYIFSKHSSVHCGIKKVEEMKTMYFNHRWIPFCINKRGSSFIVMGD